MTAKFQKFGAVAGVLADGYINRSDLSKYDLALKKGLNWFVNYEGGLASRPGTEFIDWIEHDNMNVKIAPFQYGFNVANTNVVLFGHNYIRFIQAGAYVTEAAKTVSGVASDVWTSTAHGYSDGDWIKLANGRTVVVSDKTTNTFKIKDPLGNYISMTVVGATTVARIYTIGGFPQTQIPAIRTHQNRDTLRITSADRDFFPHSLTRISQTNWTLTQEDLNNTMTRPTGLAGSGDANGTHASEVMYCVTAINEDGEESLPSNRLLITNIDDFTYEQGWAKVTWNPVANAKYYNVYRTTIAGAGKLSQANNVGFVGKAYGPMFTDNNVVPDFTKTPPQSLNPFADKKITAIEVTAGGTGYTQASVATMSDTGAGTGWRGFPIVNESGEIVAIVTIRPGENYVNPSLSVTVGTGATFNITVSGTGNIPAVSARFQQRQIYANTRNRPLGINGSKPGQYSNFDVSDIITEGDAYEFDLDADIVAPILHLTATRSGLLISTAEGLWQLRGSGEDAAVTAIDAGADRQSAVGSAEVPPLKINEDIALLDSEYAAVRLLAYSDYQKNYLSQDLSILSNHYFTKDNEVTSWDWFSGPYRLILATREDGTIVCGCIVKEHEVYGWTDWATKGYFRQVLRLRENRFDRAYCIVERIVGGTTRKYLERFADRRITNVENYVGSDCSLALGKIFPAGDVTPSAVSGVVTIAGSGTSFVSGDVGKTWRGGGGRGVVIAVTPTDLTVDIDTPITRVVPTTSVPATLPSGSWTLEAPVTSAVGLWHLEGESVVALLDGEVASGVITDGEFVQTGAETPIEFSRAVIGLAFSCVGIGLPLTSPDASIEFDRKNIKSVGAWQHESRGLKVGARPDKLYEFKEKIGEAWGHPLQSNLNMVSVSSDWTMEGYFYFEQSQPLPASLLGWVLEVDLGDDDERR